MALGIIGAGLSAFGAIAQGQQANASAQAQAGALEQQAEADRKASAYEMQQERRKQDLLRANARAQVGASGVAFAGSPTEVIAANAGQGELDIQAILFGSRLRQNNLRDQAKISRWQGRQARTAGFINAGTNFISGISQLYDPSRAVKFGSNPFANSGGLY